MRRQSESFRWSSVWRQPILIAAAFAVLLNAAVALLLVYPAWSGRASQIDELEAARNELRLYEGTATKEDTSKQTIEYWMKRVPSFLDFAGIMKAVAEAVNSSEVIFVDLRETAEVNEQQQEANTQSDIREIPLSLTVAASLDRLIELMNDLHSATRLFAVDEWDFIEMNQSERNKLDAELLQEIGYNETETLYRMTISMRAFAMPEDPGQRTPAEKQADNNDALEMLKKHFPGLRLKAGE